LNKFKRTSCLQPPIFERFSRDSDPDTDPFLESFSRDSDPGILLILILERF
jgi:hypothetical protein